MNTDPKPKLSVAIPAYREQARIADTLRSVAAFFSGIEPDFEVIVVDDGSGDGTAAAARMTALGDARVKVVELAAHAGKGAAVRQGILASSGESVLMTDADLSIPLEEYPAFRDALSGGADFVIASKELGRRAGTVSQPWARALMGRVFNLFVRAFVLPGFLDTQGGFKLMRGDAARELCGRCRIDGFAFDVELLSLAVVSGHKIVESPVHCRMTGGTSVRALSDSLAMLADLLAIRRSLKGLCREARRAQAR